MLCFDEEPTQTLTKVNTKLTNVHELSYQSVVERKLTRDTCISYGIGVKDNSYYFPYYSGDTLVAFTTAFASQTPTISNTLSLDTSGLSAGATTLSTAQMPSHLHSGGSGGSSTVDAGSTFSVANTGNTGLQAAAVHTATPFLALLRYQAASHLQPLT